MDGYEPLYRGLAKCDFLTYKERHNRYRQLQLDEGMFLFLEVSYKLNFIELKQAQNANTAVVVVLHMA